MLCHFTPKSLTAFTLWGSVLQGGLIREQPGQPEAPSVSANAAAAAQAGYGHGSSTRNNGVGGDYSLLSSGVSRCTIGEGGTIQVGGWNHHLQANWSAAFQPRGRMHGAHACRSPS